jgi:hypothetical protein
VSVPPDLIGRTAIAVIDRQLDAGARLRLADALYA